MSANHVRVMVPGVLREPRGAQWAANAVSGLQAFGRRVWQALEAAGERRAMRELAALAGRWESNDPELAARMRKAMRRDVNV
jgi:hypothetical protein